MRFAAAYGCPYSPSLCATPLPISSPPSVNIGTTYLGNPFVALVEMYEHTPPPPGVYVDMPYQVQTTGVFTILNQQHGVTCTPPAAMQVDGENPTPSPCWTGYFDQGDAAVFKDQASDIQIAGARLRSRAQASIDFLSAGDSTRIFGNVLGLFDSQATYDCLRVWPAANPNFHVEANDCTGAQDSASPIVYPSPNPTTSAGYYPVIRHNRGTTSVTHTEVGAGITNKGPFDCIYYVSWTSGALGVTITYPGQPAKSVAATSPVSVFLPVGASLIPYGGTFPTVSYTYFCLE